MTHVSPEGWNDLGSSVPSALDTSRIYTMDICCMVPRLLYYITYPEGGVYVHALLLLGSNSCVVASNRTVGLKGASLKTQHVWG